MNHLRWLASSIEQEARRRGGRRRKHDRKESQGQALYSPLLPSAPPRLLFDSFLVIP